MESQAVQLALAAYRLAWKYRRQMEAQWEPRLPELRKLDSFHRTYVAYENAMTRSEWLIEETGHVLLRASSDREPIPVDQFKGQVFERCRNRLWRRALEAYIAAFKAAAEAVS